MEYPYRISPNALRNLPLRMESLYLEIIESEDLIALCDWLNSSEYESKSGITHFFNIKTYPPQECAYDTLSLKTTYIHTFSECV